MPKLTKKMVDATEPKSTGDVWVWDSDVHGFGMRVQASGRKTYVVRYRTRDNVQRKQTIARCSDMPPDQARDLARQIFVSVAQGMDPMAAKHEEKKASVTVEDLQKRYDREWAKPYKKPSSRLVDETNWRLHIIPAMGSKLVREVTRADILTLHGSLSEKPAVANQCMALLSKAFNLAEMWEWRPENSNPCRGVKKYTIQPRELILNVDQIKQLDTTLDKLLAAKKIRKPMVDLVRLLMLTGCRLREIMDARREWVDEARNLLLLPDSKTGQRKIYLSPAAMRIIGGISKKETWLIPGRGEGVHMDTPYTAWSVIKKAAGLPMELRLHDLRHTAGSLGHAAGLSQKQIQILLGHKQASTTERYIHGQRGDEVKVMHVLAEAMSLNK